MIIFVDPLNMTSGHLDFNCTVIQAVLSASGSVQAEVICHMGHANLLLPRLRTVGLSAVRFVGVPPVNLSVPMATRFGQMRVMGRVVKQVAKQRPRAVVLLSGDNFVVPAAILVAGLHPSLHKADPRWHLILHNNIAAAHRRTGIPTLWGLAQRWVEVRPIALFAGLEEAAQESLGLLAVQHIPFPSFGHLRSSRNTGSVDGHTTSFALIGRQARRSVETGLLRRLVRAARVANSDQIKIIVAHARVPLDVPTGVNVIFTGAGLLSEEAYWKTLAEASYVVVTEGDNFQPSGVLIDAVTVGTPVLAHRSGHALSLASTPGLELGGYFYDSCRTFESAVEEAIAVSQEGYMKMVERNENLAAHLSIEATTERLNSLFCRCPVRGSD